LPCDPSYVVGDEHILRSVTEMGGAWHKVVDGQVKQNDSRGCCRVCKRKTSYWCGKCSVIPSDGISKKKVLYLCSPSKNMCYYTHCK
jgi:hypothetical protein